MTIVTILKILHHSQKKVSMLDMEEESEDYLLFSHDNCDEEYVALDDYEKKKIKKK